jgi:hypothetical protein
MLVGFNGYGFRLAQFILKKCNIVHLFTMYCKFLFLIVSLTLAIPHAQAQQGWNLSEEKWSDLQKKRSSGERKLKQWKNAISSWGLDSNYRHALAFTARLHTNGWAAGVQYVQRREQHNRLLLQVLFSEIKHDKEVKQERSSSSNTSGAKYRPYIFGKINNVYTLQVHYGREQVLFPALLNGNMTVALDYSAGAALAMLKPYYLQLIYTDFTPEPQQREAIERYSIHNQEAFLKPGNILGAAGWQNGLAEIKYIPGLTATLAVVLEPDKPRTLLKQVSIGCNTAIYTAPLVIMAGHKGSIWHSSFFVALSLGKRWK